MTDRESGNPGTRVSPPTQRVIAIIDFLARHPHDRFGLSELARRVDLSKPTCLGIVTTLSESGYLVRDTQDKTYRLGPRLITLGHIAQESMRVNPAAREELRKLSTAFDTTAALSAVVDDRITLLELVGPVDADVGVLAGQSYPFAPPVGLMFVLWDDDALRDWLAKEPTIPLRTDSERMQRVIAECRRTGYLVERLTPEWASAVRLDGRHVERPAPGVAGPARRDDLRRRRTGLPAQRVRRRPRLATTSASSPRRCSITTAARSWSPHYRSAEP